MEESGYRFGVGVLVMASAIICVLLIAFFGAAPTLWVDRNRVSFNFEKAPRVAVDTHVRKNGVLIGRVSSITLLPGNQGVLIQMELDRKVELRKGEVPRIVSGSIITGDALVEFVEPTPESNLRRFDGYTGTPPDGILDPDEAAIAAEFITDKTFLRGGEVARDPLEAIARIESTLGPAVEQMGRAFNKIDSIAGTFQNVVGDGNGPIRELVTVVKTTAEDIQMATRQIQRIGAQVENANIPEAIANGLTMLPDLFKEAQKTLDQTQKTLKGFEQFSLSLEGLGKEFDGIGATIRKAVENANVAIENIAEITQPVSENSEALVGNAVKALADIDALALDLKTIARRINNSNGTVTQLIDNPALFIEAQKTMGSIKSASENIQMLSQKFQPIVSDIRVFSDKIARNPGQLVDLGGAIRGRPRGVGTK